MNTEDLIQSLLQYGEDPEELKTLTLDELKEQLIEYEDHSNLFPNQFHNR